MPSLFVITITNYDPFGHDYMLYTIRNKCDEVPELKYEDGLKFLYFNTTGTKGGNLALKNLLTYIQESKECNVTDETTKELHDYVSGVKVSPEVRIEYMMWEEKIFYEKRDAKEEGRAEGLAEERIRIINTMLAKGKSEEEIAELLDLQIEEVQEISRKKI